MRRLALLASALFLFTALVALPSCKEIQRLLPATEVDSPEQGSPEYVIQQVLKSGMEKDTDAGWKLFRPWLHSEELSSPASEKNWRQFNFESLARNTGLYLEDPSKPVYKIDYDEESGGGSTHTWFLVNKKSDMPTPIVLKRDGKANNEWRVKRMSLGL